MDCQQSLPAIAEVPTKHGAQLGKHAQIVLKPALLAQSGRGEDPPLMPGGLEPPMKNYDEKHL